MATSKTIPMMCVRGYGERLTTGRIYETEADPFHPAAWTTVPVDDKGADRGGWMTSRFRPLTRDEEATYVRTKQAAAQSDAQPQIVAADYSALEARIAASCFGGPQPYPGGLFTLDDPQRGAPLERTSGAPDGNPKTRFGIAKPSVTLIPGTALIQMATAFRDGATKYGPANWRDDPVTASTYINAAFRHLLSYWDGENDAEDSGVHHLAHAAACLAIVLDAEAQGTLNDDRPTAGKSAQLIKEKTRPLT